MAWKEGLRFAGPEARRIHDAAFPHSPLPPGKEIRITVEEEVNECCDRWRTACIGNDNQRDCSRWLQLYGGGRYKIIFCPECGRKL